ncbi:hypothetical protein IAD21_05456 [Abditibacteriota bacterium]|nr:hypothetical protein IAD21_05456 [Abditibacteriota bacterium]
MKFTFKNITLGIGLFCIFGAWAFFQILVRQMDSRLPAGNPATLEKSIR